MFLPIFSYIHGSRISAVSPAWTFDTLVTNLAKKYGQNETLARKIIDCESQYAPKGIHENHSKDGTIWSMDWGYWQINDYYHLEPSKKLGFDIRYKWEDNLEYGFILMKNQGVKPWSASAYCWNK